MADPITQDNRLLAITTPAGKDVLLLNSFSGVEGVSRPFRFDLELVSEASIGNPSKVKPHELVGQPFTIRIALESGNERYISGLCESFSVGRQDDELAYYKASLVSWFSFLSLASNCRIFQKKTVPDIVQQVFNDCGFSDYQVSLTKDYTAWDYCVQYRETDFAFVSRILEAEGIFYYFQHDSGKHTMILSDDPGSYKPLPEENTFNYAFVTGVQEDLQDTIRTWNSEERIHAGKWSTRDFHHEMPTNNLQITEPSDAVATPGQRFEMYDYPGDHAKKFNDPAQRLGNVHPEGEKLNKNRMQELEATRVEFSGMSRCRAFTSGYKITVAGGNAGGTYLLTGVTHRVLQAPDYLNHQMPPDPYTNEFQCIDASVPFKPPQETPKPVISGLQTALVVDESSSGKSEEIWPDKYGRIRARFPWDRESKYACWLRVVQPWAGKAWGHQWLPRTGDEVAVSFLEGDPDQPVVIGSIYNSDNMPVFSLPDNKTQSGVLTHSTPKGGSSNYNMLRFEDKKDSEEIYIQAEKDWNSLIKHDETRTVKNNRTTKIHVNESRTVETGDDTIDVQQGKRTITVMGDLSETVKTGNNSIAIQTGKRSITVMSDISETSQTGNISTKADIGNISTQATLGNITIQANVGSISISGLQGVTISCGASSISMTPASISISAPMVMINS
jgi:type VI secretion system secreted protein VgrG